MIAISVKGTESIIGPIIVSAVCVPDNFFKKIGRLNLSKLDKVNSSFIVAKTAKSIPFAPYSIIPKIEKDIGHHIVNELNNIYRFWDHKIYLLNNIKFDESALERLPIIEVGYDTRLKERISRLAEAYATYRYELVLKDIREVWGAFGTGKSDDPETQRFIKEYPDCPWIRETQ